jgi:hypothetical protein
VIEKHFDATLWDPNQMLTMWDLLFLQDSMGYAVPDVWLTITTKDRPEFESDRMDFAPNVVPAPLLVYSQAEGIDYTVLVPGFYW